MRRSDQANVLLLMSFEAGAGNQCGTNQIGAPNAALGKSTTINKLYNHWRTRTERVRRGARSGIKYILPFRIREIPLNNMAKCYHEENNCSQS